MSMGSNVRLTGFVLYTVHGDMFLLRKRCKKIMSINIIFSFFINEGVGRKDKLDGSSSFNLASVAVPLLLLLLIVAGFIAVFSYQRYV